MLALFDLDDTLIRGHLDDGPDRPVAARPYEHVELLPGRFERLAELRDAGWDVAVVTNQGGVAFGYQTPAEACDKVCHALALLGLWDAGAWLRTGPHDGRGASGLWVTPPAELPPAAYVAFEHPNARMDRWRRDTSWRKPGPGMIEAAIRDYDADRFATLFVGDRPEDEQAAAAAGVEFRWADAFFAG